MVRLALRPPCLPDERRQPYAVRLAALALCAGAPVLSDLRPFGAFCGAAGILYQRARVRVLWGVLSCLVSRGFIPAAPRVLWRPCGALPCPVPASARAGAWLVLSAFAARVRINIRTAAGVSTYADAGTLPAVLAVSLPRFRCWCWCW